MYSYKYPSPAITVDALVYIKVKVDIYVLLVRRGREPFKDKWALPGGFVNMEELLETACKRELKEETGLEVQRMEQFKAFDAVDRDPRHRTISVVFSVCLPEKQKVKGSDDAAQAEWFPLLSLPELAFDHQDILNLFFR